MELGMVGLGRMGANMVRRLMKGDHDCVVFDMNADSVRQMESEGARGSRSLDDFTERLSEPRAAWVMVPAGDATDETVMALAERFEPGDIIIDGGNSYFKDDLRRAKHLAEKGIHYVDVGTSGGVWGLDRGCCMMIGGEVESVERLDPIFKTLASGSGRNRAHTGARGETGRG